MSTGIVYVLGLRWFSSPRDGARPAHQKCVEAHNSTIACGVETGDCFDPACSFSSRFGRPTEEESIALFARLVAETGAPPFDAAIDNPLGAYAAARDRERGFGERAYDREAQVYLSRGPILGARAVDAARRGDANECRELLADGRLADRDRIDARPPR